MSIIIAIIVCCFYQIGVSFLVFDACALIALADREKGADVLASFLVNDANMAEKLKDEYLTLKSKQNEKERGNKKR